MWNAVVYWQGWSLVFGGLFVIQLLREWRDRHSEKHTPHSFTRRWSNSELSGRNSARH